MYWPQTRSSQSPYSWYRQTMLSSTRPYLGRIQMAGTICKDSMSMAFAFVVSTSCGIMSLGL